MDANFQMMLSKAQIAEQRQTPPASEGFAIPPKYKEGATNQMPGGLNTNQNKNKAHTGGRCLLYI